MIHGVQIKLAISTVAAGAALLLVLSPGSFAGLRGVNLDLGISNLGDVDIREVGAVSDNKIRLADSRDLRPRYATAAERGPARGNHGIPADNGFEVPGRFQVSWKEMYYQGNSVQTRAMGPFTVPVGERIPAEVIRQARGLRGDMLSIRFGIAGERVYMQWALWPRADGKSTRPREPLRSGGDELPAIPASLIHLRTVITAANRGETAGEVLREAFAAGIDINRRYVGKTPLRHVLEKPGNGAYALQLLDAGADPNLVDLDFGVSPLMLAAGEGDVAVVKRLLAAQADVNARNSKGRGALAYAAVAGHAEIVSLLLRAGADKTVDNHYALRAASAQGHEAVVRLLK